MLGFGHHHRLHGSTQSVRFLARGRIFVVLINKFTTIGAFKDESRQVRCSLCAYHIAVEKNEGLKMNEDLWRPIWRLIL